MWLDWGQRRCGEDSHEENAQVENPSSMIALPSLSHNDQYILSLFFLLIVTLLSHFEVSLCKCTLFVFFFSSVFWHTRSKFIICCTACSIVHPHFRFCKKVCWLKMQARLCTCWGEEYRRADIEFLGTCFRNNWLAAITIIDRDTSW